MNEPIEITTEAKKLNVWMDNNDTVLFTCGMFKNGGYYLFRIYEKCIIKHDFLSILNKDITNEETKEKLILCFKEIDWNKADKKDITLFHSFHYISSDISTQIKVIKDLKLLDKYDFESVIDMSSVENVLSKEEIKEFKIDICGLKKVENIDIL
jgi:hypothetical protein